MSFVHLHCYSDYSILNSTLRVADLVQRAHSFQMSAIALTDKNNLFGLMNFFSEINDLPYLANGKKLKGIVGIELSVQGWVDKNNVFPLVLLAENKKGYKNIIELNHLSYINNSLIPYVSFKDVFKYQENIIFLSGGVGGELAQLVSTKHQKSVLEYLKMVKSEFSTGYFYLEIQNHNHQGEKKIFSTIINQAKENNLPLVATNQLCYLEREDLFSYEVLLAIGKRKIFSSEDLSRVGHTKLWGDGYHFKTYEEMVNLFPNDEEAVRNTLEIAERCQVDIFDSNVHMPVATKDLSFIPEIINTDSLKELTSDELLNKITHEKLKERKLNQPEYLERVNYELNIITKMGFSDYFLIVADFVNYAKKSNICVGVGRGSAAGSLVSFCLGITGIDPIQYGLLFERFLNPERRSLPDIDIDFQKDKRGEVVQYIKKKYGEENVAQIITFGKLKSKAILKDTARVFGMGFEEANRLSSFLNSNLSESERARKGKRSILQFFFEEDINLVSRLSQDSQLQLIYQNSIKLENLTRQTGIHAAGIVIADKKLKEYIPIIRNEDGVMLTQFEGQFLENKCGLIKIDILGLETLTLINQCIKSIKNFYQIDFNINEVPLEDKKTLTLYAKGLTAGVFQFESEGMITYLRELRPNRFEDLIAMNALYRPGPISWIPVYIAKKNNTTPQFDNGINKKNFQELINLCVKYPPLDDILAPTNRIPIFQEQIMEISKEFSGFTLGKADNLRKAMGKKDKKLISKIKKEFIQGAIKNNYPEKDAKFLYDNIIQPFGGYGFNKSHSVCYSFLSFQTAYLKANYPIFFMTALLNSELNVTGNSKKIKSYIKEAQSLKLEIISVSINSSEKFFFNNKQLIVFGLSALKHIGLNVGESIIQERKKNGPFKNIGDFIYRNDQDRVNKQSLESLIKAGAFDELGLMAEKILPHLPILIERIEKDKISQSEGQSSFFDQEGVGKELVFQDIIMQMKKNPDDKKKRKELESEILGFNLKYNSFTLQTIELIEKISNFDIGDKSSWKAWKVYRVGGILENVRTFYTKKDNKEMAILKLNNGSQSFEVICFNEVWEKKVKDKFFVEDCLELEVRLREKKQEGKNRYSLGLEKIKILQEEAVDSSVVSEVVGRELILKVNQENLSQDYLVSLRIFFRQHPGNIPISFIIEENDIKKKITTGERVKVDDQFKLEISQHYQIEDFKVIY